MKNLAVVQKTLITTNHVLVNCHDCRCRETENSRAVSAVPWFELLLEDKAYATFRRYYLAVFSLQSGSSPAVIIILFCLLLLAKC